MVPGERFNDFSLNNGLMKLSVLYHGSGKKTRGGAGNRL